MTFSDAAVYFALYAFSGWALETVYASVSARAFVNRGFLHGCFCPVYGFGALAALGAFSLTGDFFGRGSMASLAAGVLFSSAFFTALELATGFVMERLFKKRYWDYSALPLNFHGYICMSYSLLWGVFGLVMARLLHPAVAGAVAGIPAKAKSLAAAAVIACLLTDAAVSGLRTLGVKPREFRPQRLFPAGGAMALSLKRGMTFPMAFSVAGRTRRVKTGFHAAFKAIRVNIGLRTRIK
ncbi:MAG: putative ABC transporter permease [Clostridia bacterium]|nr:putative ABC transporter permease [Clostridia bacterium]MDR3644500.1 putative ABC transporter permease [Clostridia bacterium]